METTELTVSQRSDSLQLDYSVVIYPLDSFHFSPANGFSGKALKVKIRGSTQQVSFASDSSMITQSQFHSSEAVVKAEYQHDDQQKKSQKEKRTMLNLAVLLCTLLGLIFGLLAYRKYVKYRGY